MNLVVFQVNGSQIVGIDLAPIVSSYATYADCLAQSSLYVTQVNAWWRALHPTLPAKLHYTRDPIADGVHPGIRYCVKVVEGDSHPDPVSPVLSGWFGEDWGDGSTWIPFFEIRKENSE